jgi:Ca2+-binding EF-hand superfamily protein
MSKRIAVIMLLAAVFAVANLAQGQKQPASMKQADKTTLAESNAKEMLLLMDTDKNGKISKDEWMKFMSAEFDRLDKDHSGQLDPKELEGATISFRHYHFADQGK